MVSFVPQMEDVFGEIFSLEDCNKKIIDEMRGITYQLEENINWMEEQIGGLFFAGRLELEARARYSSDLVKALQDCQSALQARQKAVEDILKALIDNMSPFRRPN